MHIPHDVLVHPMAQRAATVGTAAAGGDLVENSLLATSYVDLLRNQLALLLAGATFLDGLVGNILIPRQTGTAATFWPSENGTPTESSAQFDQIPMAPKTVGTYSELSRLTLMQWTPSIDSLVMQDLAAAVTQAIDLAGITGTGASNQPKGLLNQAGVTVTALGINGANPTWNSIVNQESAAAAGKAEGTSPSYLMNSKVRGMLKRYSPGGVPHVGPQRRRESCFSGALEPGEHQHRI